MNTAELAAAFTALCQEGRFLEAVDRFYADTVVSVEAADFLGKGREMHGKATVRTKNVQWLADNEVHEATVSGPFVSPERFALVIGFDWTRRETGERVRMQEVAVYTVENGQVTREEFLYGAMG
ncbi:MAG: nuclear transport factor 2 family protein [Bryobacterales bacterium]|nr:nuclear transport factor 2 family protein [Bryobacterales bacterium]